MLDYFDISFESLLDDSYEIFSPIIANTVKTLYNIPRYNRIFNIRHKIAGNRSVFIKIPSS